jgi:hypothetical protein
MKVWDAEMVRWTRIQRDLCQHVPQNVTPRRSPDIPGPLKPPIIPARLPEKPVHHTLVTVIFS